ncbi:uncharacterized protein ACR2FA_012293 [Aphomia sociella]
MAQAEDTELRDLVVDALEKNGSLAKIRALLRANIFLAFEDETDNVKQNVSLDNILKVPEGMLCLSIVHEFLDFCNLKNTLFVYKSETRQGKEYNYGGQKSLLDKLYMTKHDCIKEPVLLMLLKSLLKHQKIDIQSKGVNNTKQENNDPTYNQNCTYIVNEDSSTTASNSQSDNSLDEKNKLHLRLPLDNSDTDTSSDSARDKTSSEYVLNQHVIESAQHQRESVIQNVNSLISNNQIIAPSYYLNDLKVNNNSSSDSTSYVELKPYNSVDEKMLNTTGVPILDNTINIDNNIESSKQIQQNKSIEQTDINKNTNVSKVDTLPSPSISYASSTSLKKDNSKESVHETKGHEEHGKSDGETIDYSYDFSSSENSKKDSIAPLKSPISINEVSKSNKNVTNDSQLQNSQDSHSSISISDIADLLSEKSSSFGHTNDIDSSDNKHKGSSNKISKRNSNNDDDSGDFSESPVPSLSNLSLDVHSE